MSLLRTLAVCAVLLGVSTLPAQTQLFPGNDNAPFCVKGEGVCVLFAHGTSPDYVREFMAHLPKPPLSAQYTLDGRWSQTPFGSAGVQGDPIRLTFSFAPDGTALPTLEHEAPTPSILHSVFNAAFPGGENTWKSKIRAALGRWAQVANITLTEVSDDGAPFPNSFGRNTTPIRGEIRIAGHPIDGTTNENNVLAVTTTPDGGDIVIDTDDIAFFTNATLDYVFFRNTICHECGHALGLDHSDPVEGSKLMERLVSTRFDGPQDDDIRAAQRYYGDRAENNDTAMTASPLPGFAFRFDLLQLSTDSSSDEDWFTFPTEPTRLLTVSVVPVGSSYLLGPGIAPPTVDTLRINKLGIEIYDSNQVLLARANAAAKGTPELVLDLPVDNPAHLPSFVFIRVYNVSTSSFSVVDDVQRYNLSLDETRFGATFGGSVRLQSVVNPAVPLHFEFRSAAHPFSRTVTLNSSGAFSLTNVPTGTYQVAVKGDRWLRGTAAVTITPSGVNGFAIDLRGGDSNDDNVVDITDLLALIAHYNQVQGASGSTYAANVDFDNDGSDNISDLLLLISNFNQHGDP